mgnify:CR=1 FL=1
MKYCKYCGRQSADDRLCDCEDAKAERNEDTSSSDEHQRVEKEVEAYDYDISFNLDDYRVKTDGVANDYQSDRGPLLRLGEDGNAYYVQYDDETLDGTWEGDGENFKLSLRGINEGKPLSGIVTESKKIRLPDQDGWSGEVFTKMY